MIPILIGTETEYGFTVEGRTVKNQADDAIAFVRSYPDEGYSGWDYRYESPRSDMRGFQVSQLAYDRRDAEYDRGRQRTSAEDERSDWVLPNGARFYNDHGHPEYSTPECFSPNQAALHDYAGQTVVCRAAEAYAAETGREVAVYKNNTDYSGASYGTHDNFLVPRDIPIDELIQAITPMLIARQFLTGAGKVGSESGGPVRFQLSQRADFFEEAVNLETLSRRPIFNTRDEPHSDSQQWRRMHVITCDANLMPSCTARRLFLVQLAIRLLLEGKAPLWRVSDPVRSFKLTSRDLEGDGRIETEEGLVTARSVAESYLDAGSELDLDEESREHLSECQQLLEARKSNFEWFKSKVDWAAKYWLLDQFRESEGLSWHDPHMQSLDLEYHQVSGEDQLFAGLAEGGFVDALPSDAQVEACLRGDDLDSRALVRSLAVSKWKEHLVTASWTSLVVRPDLNQQTTEEIKLRPEIRYDEGLRRVESFAEFCQCIKEQA
ncbi:MAG: proteasome accessory factor PafA2 family protein [Armatimonadetes bacterium]|nr:proteasome accessory factor PafA2 family protein [Armatimonadota bacterium]